MTNASCPSTSLTTIVSTAPGFLSSLCSFWRTSIWLGVETTTIGKVGSKSYSGRGVGKIPDFIAASFDGGGEIKTSPVAGLEEIYVWAMRHAASLAKMTGAKGMVVNLIAERNSV